MLFSVCVSSSGSGFAFVTATPVQRAGGVVAQPGYFYLRRVGDGYRRLDPLLTARTADRRPRGLPEDVYRAFRTTKACGFQGPSAVKRVLQEHAAPSFRTG